MGRRKIEIQPIDDERNRTVTFVKRKAGLFKKAHELAILCKVDIAVLIVGHNHKIYEYSSNKTSDVIEKFKKSGRPYESKKPSDYGKYKYESRISPTLNSNIKRGHQRKSSEPTILNNDSDSDDDDEDSDSDDSNPATKKRKISQASNIGGTPSITNLNANKPMPASFHTKRSSTSSFNANSPRQIINSNTPGNSKRSQRPTLSLQIPTTDKSSSDSAVTVTAIQSSSIDSKHSKDDNNNNNTNNNNNKTTHNASSPNSGRDQRKLMIPSSTPTNYLPGLNILTQSGDNMSHVIDNNKSNNSTPISATLPHGLFSSLPQMSPSQILPTPIFPLQTPNPSQSQPLGPPGGGNTLSMMPSSAISLQNSQSLSAFYAGQQFSAKFGPKSANFNGLGSFQQFQPTSTGETPILPSGLPSKFVDLFPSPSNAYYSQEWQIPLGTGTTPLPSSAPHLLPMINTITQQQQQQLQQQQQQQQQSNPTSNSNTATNSSSSTSTTVTTSSMAGRISSTNSNNTTLPGIRATTTPLTNSTTSFQNNNALTTTPIRQALSNNRQSITSLTNNTSPTPAGPPSLNQPNVNATSNPGGGTAVDGTTKDGTNTSPLQVIGGSIFQQAQQAQQQRDSGDGAVPGGVKEEKRTVKFEDGVKG